MNGSEISDNVGCYLIIIIIIMTLFHEDNILSYYALI